MNKYNKKKSVFLKLNNELIYEISKMTDLSVLNETLKNKYDPYLLKTEFILNNITENEYIKYKNINKCSIFGSILLEKYYNSQITDLTYHIHFSTQDFNINDSLNIFENSLLSLDLRGMLEINNYLNIPPSLINLRYLRLTYYPIFEIPKEFVNLVELICDYCKLNYIPNTLINLKKLNCGYNDITEIPDTLINLEELKFSNCKITKIPDILVKLKILTCNFNQIMEIPKTLTNLTHLEVKNCGITKIPDTLINLIYLDCSYNEIKEIPNTLVKLKYLSCSNNQIIEIPDTLINLEALFCISCQVTKIPDTLINLIMFNYNIINYELFNTKFNNLQRKL